MEHPYRKFYRSFYAHTGGFIPTKPLGMTIYPGDFFQIRNGELIILGNIFRAGVIDPDDVEFGYGIRLNQVGWNFSEAISKPYSGRGSGHRPIEGSFEFSKQVIGFGARGAFFFKGNQPESAKILNWNDIQQALIIKMTQTMFSFRQLYIATEVATVSDWTLAIAGQANAELEIATDSENFGLSDIFGHENSKTIQSKEIEYYNREAHRKPAFFKAKKLVVQDERMETFISDLIANMTDHSIWAGEFFDDKFFNEPVSYAGVSPAASVSMIDMLQANQLNPNTALLYFKWAEANLDDIERLFISHGD